MNASWTLEADGATVMDGAIPLRSLGPQASLESSLPMSLEDACSVLASMSCVLDVSFKRIVATTLLPVGHEEAWYQFSLPWRHPFAHPTREIAAQLGALTISEHAGLLSVIGFNFAAHFNTTSGCLKQWHSHGQELLHEPLAPNFWRPPTDNDLSLIHI